MFLVPLINPVLKGLDKKRFILLLLIIWFLWYTIGSVAGSPFFILQKGLFFYSVGAFFGLFNINTNNNNNKIRCLLVFCISWILAAFFSYGIATFGVFQDVKLNKVMFKFLQMLNTGITIPVCSMSLFLLFNSIDIGTVKSINIVASTTFGVYLLHDSAVGRYLFWYKIFKVDTVLYNSFWFPVLIPLVVLTIFIICLLIDLIRQKYFEQSIYDLLNTYKKRLLNC